MKNKLDKVFKIGKSTKMAGILILIIICCIMLTGCDPGSYYFSHEYLSDIVRIELINYDNPEQKHFLSWAPDHTSDLKPFDSLKLSVLETLDEDKIPHLIDTLCECEILGTYYAYDSPNGICLKLSYSNGDFLIINSNYQNKSFAGYIGKFSPDCEVAEFIGCFAALSSFETLVNDYFQTKI